MTHRRLPVTVMSSAALLGAMLLAGCATGAPRPEKLAAGAQAALDKGETPQAITLAEAATAADGRNAGVRMLLGNAYLHAGRFESARQAYADAMELGEDSSRAALGLVLADLALGNQAAAVDTLNTYGDVLAPADLGLALVMAGQGERGVTVLTNAIRSGQNAPKVRQNLAYAYALTGAWREAKIMAGQDLPADQVDARLQSWAAMARPEDQRRRVATLLGVPLRGDAGQPEALALAHFPKPGAPAPAPQTAEAAPAVAPSGELPAVAPASLARIDVPPATQTAQPEPAQPVAAPAAPPLLARAVPTHVLPARLAPATPLARPAAPVIGTHVVQLGAFGSEEGARRAWHHFAARDPRLAGHRSLITKVSVHGRDFWRVQAAGFVGQASAGAMCGTVRAHGGVCMVLALASAGQVAPDAPAPVRVAIARK